MEQKNIKLYIIPFIAIGVFTLILFAAGYAYFTGSTTMSTSNYQINMPMTTSLICTKTDCSATITPDMMTNTNTNSTTPKATSTCYVNCTCSGTQGATCNYNVSLFELGSAYTPSSGLGTNKEFTVKVTSPSGCTTINSSSTETQVNTQVDKILSQCSLTVPSGGSITANVSAQFKWYNLNLDQTNHANTIYEYGLSTAERQVIYRNTTDRAEIGDNISVLTSGYETDKSNISQSYYLKHIVENNIIVANYACIKYTESGVLKEACVQGGDPSYYGSYDGMSSDWISTPSNPTGNIKKIQSVQNYFEGTLNGWCNYSSSDSYCHDGSTLYLRAYSDGDVNSLASSTGLCYVSTIGIAYCNTWG